MPESDVAPEGTVWVCLACGRTADHKKNMDISCFLHAVLCKEEKEPHPETGEMVYIPAEPDSDDSS